MLFMSMALDKEVVSHFPSKSGNDRPGQSLKCCKALSHSSGARPVKKGAVVLHSTTELAEMQGEGG